MTRPFLTNIFNEWFPAFQLFGRKQDVEYAHGFTSYTKFYHLQQQQRTIGHAQCGCSNWLRLLPHRLSRFSSILTCVDPEFLTNICSIHVHPAVHSWPTGALDAQDVLSTAYGGWSCQWLMSNYIYIYEDREYKYWDSAWMHTASLSINLVCADDIRTLHVPIRLCTFDSVKILCTAQTATFLFMQHCFQKLSNQKNIAV